jgi:hypothetical protein
VVKFLLYVRPHNIQVSRPDSQSNFTKQMVLSKLSNQVNITLPGYMDSFVHSEKIHISHLLLNLVYSLKYRHSCCPHRFIF